MRISRRKENEYQRYNLDSHVLENAYPLQPRMYQCEVLDDQLVFKNSIKKNHVIPISLAVQKLQGWKLLLILLGKLIYKMLS